LSPPSPPPERRAGAAGTPARWSGPALAIIGAVILASVEFLPATTQSTLAWWILTSALAPIRVLPLFGLGIAIGLNGGRPAIAALALFVAGMVLGFLTEDRFVAALAAFPRAASQDFLTGPLSCVAVGLSLAPAARLRKWLLPLAAIFAGAVSVFAIRVTDPSLHDPLIPLAGVLIALWIVVSSALTIHAYRRDWFVIPGRIVGSWLIAVGLLYGGTSLIPKRSPPLPVATPPQAPLPGLDRDVPGMSAPEQGASPGTPPGDFRQ
jgi:hypothetical protein